MTIKSVDRHEVREAFVLNGEVIDWDVWDLETNEDIANSHHKGHAEHIAHCLNAFNHLIASVEALP